MIIGHLICETYNANLLFRVQNSGAETNKIMIVGDFHILIL